MKVFNTFLMIFLGIVKLNSQQNLVPNGSFEKVNEVVFNNLNNADVFENSVSGPNYMTTHFPIFKPEIGLFHCWEGEDVNSSGSLNSDGGICYGIVPGLFPITGGTQYLSNEYGFTKVLGANDGDPRILGYTNTSLGFKLSINPLNGLLGIDCSPPNSKFGENFNAQHGQNYLAMLDYRFPDNNIDDGKTAYPHMRAKLESPLSKDVKYYFEISVAKMNLLETISSNEGWDNTEDPRVKVYVAKKNSNNDNYSDKKEISNRKYSETDWFIKIDDFVADKEYDYIIIEMDPILNSGIFGGKKISGCFIDNLKLYEYCETPQNQCVNANYRKDLLDVKLDKVELWDPTTFSEQNSNDPMGYIKTIRAENLENVKRLEMNIYNDNDELVRAIDHWYPESTYVWDGRNDQGVMTPDGSYKAVITVVQNDCWEILLADVKSFQKESHYEIFNVSISNYIADGNLIIHNLDNVNNLHVQLNSTIGATIYEFDLVNPPNSIAISKNALLEFTDINPSYLSPAQYNLILTVSNNCSSSTFTDDGVSIYTTTTSSNDIVYDWTPVSKPVFICPFIRNYEDNYLPPRNCCEGSLYLENVEINTSWNVNILNNIYISNNVTFNPGSTVNLSAGQNILFAGQSIIVSPGGTSVLLGPTTYLYPGIYNCMMCLTANGPDSEIIEYAQMEFEDFKVQKDSVSFILSPNPVSNQSVFKIASNINCFDENMRISMFNSIGAVVNFKVLEIQPNNVQIKTDDKLSSGIYFINIQSNDYFKHFTLKVE